MDCPTCGTDTLQELHLATSRVVVDRCSDCGGVWFDRSELEAIMEVAAKDLAVPSDAEQSDRPCPRDGELMYAFKYPQTPVTVDMCRSCHGLWLDGGELTEIKQVRTQLSQHGALQPDEPATGILGGLQRLIDWAGDLAEAD